MENRDRSHQGWRKKGHVGYELEREHQEQSFFCLLIPDLKIK